jgi:DNA-binding PadR family transcriptional regulator
VAVRSLQEPTFLILTALAAGPQHGYGIISDIERISDRHVRLRAGTLYAALDRLEGEGFVELDREEVVQGRLRRYYKLTAAGAQRLSAEIHRLRRHANAASRRLRAGGSPVYGLADERRYR